MHIVQSVSIRQTDNSYPKDMMTSHNNQQHDDFRRRILVLLV